MSRELILLRHGKSDWGVEVDDFNRPLKNRGKRAAQRAGAWLQEHGCLPDLVMTSPAERTLATAHKCCKAMGSDTRSIRVDERLYEAGSETLLTVLADLPGSARRVLLVGHNPGLENLLVFLSGALLPIPEDGKLLPTGAFVRLVMPDNWRGLAAGCARVTSWHRPSGLPRDFPFPLEKPRERRERPAYYYTQSGVIPYRLDNRQLQILMVRSSGNKGWVIPKGIAEPGLTPQESAAIEAYEEAGVEGQVTEKALGSCRYEKWGAECQLTVYGMQVTRQITDDEWPENHRGRLWVSAEQACELVRQKALVPMIRQLQKRLEGAH